MFYLWSHGFLLGSFGFPCTNQRHARLIGPQYLFILTVRAGKAEGSSCQAPLGSAETKNCELGTQAMTLKLFSALRLMGQVFSLRPAQCLLTRLHGLAIVHSSALFSKMYSPSFATALYICIFFFYSRIGPLIYPEVQWESCVVIKFFPPLLWGLCHKESPLTQYLVVVSADHEELSLPGLLARWT